MMMNQEYITWPSVSLWHIGCKLLKTLIRSGGGSWTRGTIFTDLHVNWNPVDGFQPPALESVYMNLTKFCRAWGSSSDPDLWAICPARHPQVRPTQVLREQGGRSTQWSTEVVQDARISKATDGLAWWRNAWLPWRMLWPQSGGKRIGVLHLCNRKSRRRRAGIALSRIRTWRRIQSERKGEKYVSSNTYTNVWGKSTHPIKYSMPTFIMMSAERKLQPTESAHWST